MQGSLIEAAGGSGGGGMVVHHYAEATPNGVISGGGLEVDVNFTVPSDNLCALVEVFVRLSIHGTLTNPANYDSCSIHLDPLSTDLIIADAHFIYQQSENVLNDNVPATLMVNAITPPLTAGTHTIGAVFFSNAPNDNIYSSESKVRVLVIGAS